MRSLRHTTPGIDKDGHPRFLIIITPLHGSCRRSIASRLLDAFTSSPFLLNMVSLIILISLQMSGNLFVRLEGMTSLA